MERIAIVNRGDAASRCIRAIRELRTATGERLQAIALYTDPDRDAPFVRDADVALSLGAALRRGRGGAPRLAYLDHGRVLAALRATGADAVWPGWGFLAEDADFAAAVEERGLCFIGPPSAAMRRVGDKIAAKQLAESCGVPVAAWSGGALDAAAAPAAARRIGLPLMVKAAAGGGGRGIRVVERWEDLDGAIARAAAEASAAFGDGRLFLEALLPRARHLEVQIAADAAGACLALGLRDCSVQRRHQKLIEEAPPPDLAPALDAALRDAARRLARAAGYQGVGTVEFLLAAGGADFVFLEINPRLQVEHGLTELLTGFDLVQWQLRLARGERLPADAPAERGHAIEARVCAEDPAADFAPAPGRVVRYDPPGGPGVRVDAGVTLGSDVPPEFDALIAKVLAHAPSRGEALARLTCALDEFRLVLDGGATNKGLLLDLLADPALRRGAVDVGWLDRAAPRPPAEAAGIAALIAAAIQCHADARAAARETFYAEAAIGAPRSVPPSTGMTVDLAYAGERYRLHVLAIGDWRYRIGLDGRECVVRWLAEPPHAARLELGDARHAVTLAAAAGALRIEIDGRPHRVARDDGGAVRAVAPAVVIAVDVAVGDQVRAGQRLALLETMKVEVPVLAPAAGVVRAVAVHPNARVAAGALLVRVEAARRADAAAAPGARLALPDWRDPLAALTDGDGAVDLAAFAAADLLTRERSVDAVRGALRRLLLGYDRRPDIDAPVDALLAAPLPAPAALDRLAELAAPLRDAVCLFADTEALFARQPLLAADGSLGPSHEAWLRLYLRQRAARGAGLPEHVVALLRRALGHYGCGDLTPGDALDRALLRLFAAQTRRDDRQRVVAAALRWLTRLVAAGAGFDDDRELAAALGTCLTLRGQVSDGLADAAADARYVIVERPAMQRRAAAALAEALAPLTRPDAAIDLETMQRLADSPPEVFAHIAAWARDGDAAQRDVALQALVLRQYAPLAPRHRRASSGAGWNAVRLDCGAHGIVHAALAAPGQAAAAAAALGAAAGGDTPALLELLLPVEAPLDAAALAARAAPLAAAAPAGARRLCVTALAADGRRRHHTLERAGEAWAERRDLLGLHPETARRLALDRLADFSLERLASGEGLYAFYARSRSAADDERIFVLAEVRAALPGAQGALHEPAFVHAFAEAVRALRAIRGERDRWRRLHWNRITLVVRPALYLLPATLDRLVEQLTPATRHLGLEKIVVRLLLRERPDGGAETARELVVEPSAGGAVEISWRAPHRAPLRPASAVEQRIAEARRRGLVHPAEAVRLFTAAPGARFEEFDLGSGGGAVSVDGRPPGGHTGGIVFGLVTRPTDKHPEGMTRVLLLSDPTRELGALAGPECDRIVAALDLAAARDLPVEWVATSAGARIAMDSGTENLDATARVVRRIVRFTDAGGVLHVIVAGVNVGAQSYFDALATMGPTTRGILIMLAGSAMVLTGRLALEASGGVAAEDETGIGGFDRIMGPSGQAQYYARDLAAAHALLLEHYRFTYRAPGEARPRRHATADAADRSIADAPYPADDPNGFASVGEIVSDATNPGRKRPFAMRPVLRALIDQDGGWLERWAGLAGGETAIVADAHLGGHAVCVIGIESQPVPRIGPRAVDGPAEWSAGTLFPLAAKKVARALAAASGVRPAVIVATLAGFDGSPESMRTLQLEHGAAIARAVVRFDGPLLFAVVSRYHGGAYVVFSRALNDQLYAVALEGAYASVIGGSAAATAVFGREVRARADADPRLQDLRAALARSRDPQRTVALEAELAQRREQLLREQHGAVAREFDAVHTVERARAVGSLDAIVGPAALRPHLIARLNASHHAGRGRA